LGQDPSPSSRSISLGWRSPTRALSVALALTSAAIICAWVLLAAVHVDDRYKLDHVSGARTALAQYFNAGILYPELYDGYFYGGTRFMPLPIVLHGAVARITGEYLISGKLLNYGVMFALLGTSFAVLRCMCCSLPTAVGLVATVIGTPTGLAAGMGLRADTLPLLLQMLALVVVARNQQARAMVAAAALAVLALFCKLHALWAPLAICLWLLATGRPRRLTWFVGAYVAFVGTLLLVFAVASEGRIVENVLGLSTAGVDGARSVVRAPYILLRLLVEQATGAWVLLPGAAVAAWLALRDRRPTLWLFALACCLGVLLVVLSDVGTGWNQLIDPVVLTALVVGQLVGRSWPSPAAAATPAVIALILVWVNVGAVATTIAPDAQRAFAALRGTDSVSYSPQPLAGLATSSSRVLSEDPYVPVSLGQRPVVLDPFMLQRIGRRDPPAVQTLVDRIRGREFELVVLVEPLEPVDRLWWTAMHFGSNIAEALASSYVPSGRVQGYYLYRPAPERPTSGVS
jgi:hypothetical protein